MEPLNHLTVKLYGQGDSSFQGDTQLELRVSKSREVTLVPSLTVKMQMWSDPHHPTAFTD